MLRRISLVVLIFASFLLRSVAQQLSQDAKIAVVTVEPGKELYDVFGHSLLWIYDPSLGIDQAYSWGGYDFSTPNFYGKFVRGTLPYRMSYATLAQNQDYYQRENRGMTLQELRLSPAQKQAIFDEIQAQYNDPDRRIYPYKFFFDNCATRVRDAVLIAVKDTNNLIQDNNLAGQSYRQWMNKCLTRGHQDWAAVGMNMALGLPSDEKVGPYKACYLPENLEAALRTAKVPVVANEIPLFQTFPKEDNSTPFLQSPSFIFSLFLIFTIFISYKNRKANKGFTLFDKILFGLVGFIGWFLFFLGVGTDHGVTNWNLNLLWAFPLHIPLAFTVKDKAKYFKLTSILIVISLFFVAGYSFDLLLFVLPILVRSIYHATGKNA